MKNYVRKILEDKRLVIGIAIAVLVVGAILVSRFGDQKDEAALPNAFTRAVELASVAELSKETVPLETVGTVRSRTEADLRAEGQGRVIGVFRSLGEAVAPGALIAEIENSKERALVFQAQGAVDAAEAALLKAKSGARFEQLVILEERVRDADQAFAEAKNTTVSVTRDSFESVDNVIRNRVDDLFESASSDSPKLKKLFPIANLNSEVEWERVGIGRMLNFWQDSLSSLSSDSDLEIFLKEAEENIAQIRKFVNKMAQGVNAYRESGDLTQTQIDAWKASMSTARTTISSLANTLASQATVLSGKEAALAIAGQELEQGVSGEREEDILAFEAQLTQALGALQSAQASLEKTRTRSPISGTVNNLSVGEGDFVSVFDPIATVANNSALEIETFVTGEDLRFVLVGTEALIEGRYEGVVTRVGSGLDPVTKKIKVQVGLSGEVDALVHGDSVRVALSRDGGEKTQDGRITIPIAALKIETDRIVVFSTDEKNRLIAHEVSVGPLLGEKVIIENGLVPELLIVLDARGLSEGDEVVVSGE